MALGIKRPAGNSIALREARMEVFYVVISKPSAYHMHARVFGVSSHRTEASTPVEAHEIASVRASGMYASVNFVLLSSTEKANLCAVCESSTKHDIAEMRTTDVNNRVP